MRRSAPWVLWGLFAGCNRQAAPSQAPSPEVSEPSGVVESDLPPPLGEQATDETAPSDDDAEPDARDRGVEAAPPEPESSDEAYRRAAKRPLMAVMANAIDAPEPDPDKLDAARTTKQPGRSVVRFCVTPSGRTDHIKTVRGFRNDPAIDQVYEDTVRTWRFVPFVVGGETILMCTTRTFDFE